MVEDMKRYFLRLMKMVDGLHAIVITDRDGVPVLKVCNENSPELAMKPRFLATFGMATEQASKLGLGRNKSIIAEIGSYQIISISRLPLVINMIADAEANTGMITGLQNDMESMLQDLRAAVDIS